MPANLTPEYKAAEAAYKSAADPRERLAGLKEMLRTIPKHKGTEHLRADIKTRVKELTDEIATAKKTGARGGPPTVIRPEGAAQVSLVGPPNTGKSSLHAALTGSHAEVGPYPFATQYPLPGMLPVDDVAIQLVDQPSISPQHPIPWIGNALQTADAAVFVVDLSPGCVEGVVQAIEILAERQILLTPRWPADGGDDPGDDAVPDPFTTVLPTVLVVNKAERLDAVQDELEVLEDLAGVDFPSLTTSVETGEGLDRLGPWLFERLGIVRVYTKIPGASADLGRPFTVRVGQTVGDVAELVHRDIAASLKYARIWGKGWFDGQQVGRDHPVRDGDVVELHS
ncbi:MAG: TGS domain-containing protein [Actinobacteria bacterium]|nr:TGS domain-containing protein [Actinomycetota bacterium]